MPRHARPCPQTSANVQELTPKQALFVAEYAVKRNATQAAIRAGYSEKTADQQASRLLTKVKVRAAVAAKQAEQLARVDLREEDALRAIAPARAGRRLCGRARSGGRAGEFEKFERLIARSGHERRRVRHREAEPHVGRRQSRHGHQGQDAGSVALCGAGGSDFEARREPAGPACEAQLRRQAVAHRLEHLLGGGFLEA